MTDFAVFAKGSIARAVLVGVLTLAIFEIAKRSLFTPETEWIGLD